MLYRLGGYNNPVLADFVHSTNNPTLEVLVVDLLCIGYRCNSSRMPQHKRGSWRQPNNGKKLDLVVNVTIHIFIPKGSLADTHQFIVITPGAAFGAPTC